MRGIRTLLKELNELGDSDTIKNFESFMSECVRVIDALESGVKLDSLKFKRFSPAMKAGLAKSLPDMERAMCDALENQEWLPLELTAQLILIYLDAGTRALLSPNSPRAYRAHLGA
jgi:hypothetical protein